MSAVPATQLIKLRGGVRDGDYQQLSKPAAYPNSVVVDRIPNKNETQIPIGRDIVYLISNDYDAHGVRYYDERLTDPDTGMYELGVAHRPGRVRRDG
jgi:hypothetical protein